jgi:hypothetical protein
MKPNRVTLFLVLCALMIGACNLTTLPPPTATPRPTIPSVQPTPRPNVTPIVIEGENGELCIVPEGWVRYVVEAGDSMLLLAQQTDSSVAEISQANCLADPNNLFVGQTLYVPRPPVIS